ncbi:MAG: SPOR domain-containing protein [Pseudomonadales bacterium]|nr:SPOR domain-containing protein [Pseudomonadales bacterium]MBO6597487.1 SPOR domain-containing protein [Pseudomonadales bacterium]MBO6659026.1 SPOR domain-containing protein [Pseudomonadales bacterium]MBO6703018.1 SPOR domain-containing protein [Pseudomonadales bacterium]MBO6824221.1 SPOR domain-containing protein [Pseudomonadales bacterium]
MRLIFYALVLVNLAVFIYLVLRDAPQAAKVTDSSATGDVAMIQLLSEQGGVDERRIEVAEVLRNAVTVEPQSERETNCRGLGPFEDILLAQNVTERLNAAGVSVSLNALDTATGEFDFRVVIPPLPSLQEAFRRLRELKSRDIDSYVITQGQDAQGISLGVFSSDEAAQRHSTFLAERGYEAEIKRIPRLSRSYWIHSRGGLLSNSDLEMLIEGIPEVSLSETACIN